MTSQTERPSSSPLGWTYDVFLSFSGVDTRKKFTDHLYTALTQKGIFTFRDEEELERGTAINPKLLKAIEESRYVIVILSKNYASSRWCLDELAKAVECMKAVGQTILPVFYDVDPSDVRKQAGDHFGKAFLKHREDFNPDRVQRWRDALSQVGNLSGWDLRDGYESKVIRDIVGKIFTTLNQLAIPILPSTPPPPRWKYDVYVSFHGDGPHLGFVDHLYDALDKNAVVTFRDDKILERGSSISSVVLKAIEESRVALIIVSANYASSSWCLDELWNIFQCKSMERDIIPVYYEMNILLLRQQGGVNKILLRPEVTEHEEVYWEKWDKLNMWQQQCRDALVQLCYIDGFALDSENVPETIIGQICGEVKKSYTPSTNVHKGMVGLQKGMVGLESRIHDLVRNYVCPHFLNVRIIGIHGMRGIGKTTVARAVYHHIRDGFESSCFLSNVRERSKKDGLVSLQEELLSRMLSTEIGVEDEYAGTALIKKWLCRRRVLFVIDDVDDLTQLENLAGCHDWFGLGSRIIITTTDVHLLKAYDDGVDGIYEATGLLYGESLELLCLKAFKKSQPPEDHLHLCHHILNYACGLPLALEVIGSFLCGRSMGEWVSAIGRLKNKPERSIIDVLQISFDGLGETEKEIFLHIACFYKGKSRDRVIQILDYCQLSPVIGLSVLVDKSLVTISNNKLLMHDLLQEMGWEIVRRESPNNPGKRSRLWSHEDIHTVLKKDKGTEAVQGMVMDLPKLEVAQWKPEAFSNLSQLSFLQIRNVDLPKGPTCLSNSLKLLEWSRFPLRFLPQDFESDELIELNLCYSNIEQLWQGAKNFDKLKFLKLCHSESLCETPDFTGVQNLERLDLEGCKKLVRIHPSLGVFRKLILLNLKDCESLMSLPDKIEMESLETLILSNCSSLKKIPEFVGYMERLLVLNLDKTAIETLPPSIERLSGLVSLDLSNCKNLVSLPHTINGLNSLQNLSLSGCLKLGEHQGSVRETGYMEGNGASRAAVAELPSWKDSLSHCFEVVREHFSWSLPSRSMQRVNTEPMSMQLNLSGLCNLTHLNISNCNLGDGAFPNNFGCFPSLMALNLSGNDFVKLPSSIKSFLKLENLNLENCKRLKELSELPSNSKLDVRADGCSSLEMLFDASNFNRLEKSYFNFINCFRLNDSQGCSNIAFEMLKTFIPQVISNARETFQIVIPGSKIPEWFDHRTVGSSLSVKLPPFWSNSKFMGFAFCVVFVIHELHGFGIPHEFKTFNATHHLVCCMTLNGFELQQVYGKQPAFRFSEQFCQVESDHLWTFYVSRDKYFAAEWWNSSCSQLEFLFKTRGPGLKVKECGVHLIYEQGVQELNQKMTQLSKRVSPCGNILIDVDKPVEEEEKRIKKEKESRKKRNQLKQKPVKLVPEPAD
ncbi:putative TIR domain, P-loop containing nucleoside triphosphate hydrolase [Rosa chinensis]|uniref:ADP-ribosyl cyclase/cyclic ADP-ribose hydrolase n=1 Tax=Rosa chinensis TaxID=74649 RepID=A0A2P6RMB3_ROSCH|nr:TMV resistance protein N isoform X1 [Rosa chinensis]PRQ47568.1 putative TIR domain, P-loop containing nucleoside triphosphate hydrolase [Rosa chinensis]